MTAIILGSILFVAQAAPAGPPQAPPRSEYTVGPEDVLTISVFEEPQLTGRFTVDYDGTVSFPMIGRVEVAGRRLRDIEGRLAALLADGFLKNPQVTVAVEEYRSQSITVSGEVRAPGRFALKGRMTILDAVVEAGSVTAAAGSLIQLVRPRRDDGGDTGNSHAEIVTVDFAELRGGQSAGNHLLRDGDTVVVLPARPIFVTGHVRSPGAYAAQPGMTVLQAVSLAGGFAERGSNRRLKILRVVDGHKKEIDVKLTDVVEAGDTIIVPKRFF